MAQEAFPTSTRRSAVACARWAQGGTRSDYIVVAHPEYALGPRPRSLLFDPPRGKVGSGASATSQTWQDPPEIGLAKPRSA